MKIMNKIELAKSFVPLTLFVVLLTLLAFSCKKKTEDPQTVSNVSGYWEYKMPAPLGENMDNLVGCFSAGTHFACFINDYLIIHDTYLFHLAPACIACYFWL